MQKAAHDILKKKKRAGGPLRYKILKCIVQLYNLKVCIAIKLKI